jgi:hypothetical protein
MIIEHNCVVLIDFDNFFKKEIADYNEIEIKLCVEQIIEAALRTIPDISKISIRLYGGWHEDTHLSKKASAAMQLFSLISFFPIHSSKQDILIHGEVEFVTEILQIPQFKWFHTYKEREGISHVRINHDNISELCHNSKELCPVFILSSFTKSKSKMCKVSGCTHVQKDVFISKEQKMVDTLIACDIISLMDNQEVHSMFLVSEDMDHLPALAFGRSKTSNQKLIGLCITNEEIIPVFNSIASEFGIDIILLS